MLKKITALSIALSLSACVKFEVNPGDVVADTVDAGKGIYRSVKQNYKDEENRQYNHSIEYDTAQSKAQNITQCKKEIIETLEASEFELSQTVTESSRIVKEANTGIQRIDCTLEVVVRPKA